MIFKKNVILISLLIIAVYFAMRDYRQSDIHQFQLYEWEDSFEYDSKSEWQKLKNIETITETTLELDQIASFHNCIDKFQYSNTTMCGSVKIDNDILNMWEWRVYAKQLNVSYEEMVLMMAISIHETQMFTSYKFETKNNLGGITCNKRNIVISCDDGFSVYDNVYDGIYDIMYLLKTHYINKGLDTINKIQTVYAPIGATNDPENLNNNWIRKVTQYYKMLLQDA
jgi:hypothetical protein